MNTLAFERQQSSMGSTISDFIETLEKTSLSEIEAVKKTAAPKKEAKKKKTPSATPPPIPKKRRHHFLFGKKASQG